MTISFNGVDYEPMETAPRDGSAINVLCVSKADIKIVVKNLWYGFKPMSRDDKEMILWGTQNFLSPYLTPLGWRPLDEDQVKAKDKAKGDSE